MKQYVCDGNETDLKDVIVSYDSTCMMIEVDEKYVISIFPDKKRFVVDIIGGN
jgi:hypothetical protein